MTYFNAIETRQLQFVDDKGNPVATTKVVKNNRGQMARISTQFEGDYPGESETVAGPKAWKKGEILIQHQLHDGRGKCRLAVSGVVDSNDGLSWVIDSTTTSPSGSAGQEEAAPLVLNVGEAKGTYIVLFADGRVKLKYQGQSILTTIPDIIDVLSK